MSKFIMTVLFLLCTIAICAVHSQDPLSFVCNAQATCDECITASPLCSWCADPVGSFTAGAPRCYLSTESVTCSDPQNPRGEILETSDDVFSELNQIIPRTVSVALRRGEPQTFNFSVKPAANYPLDLYLLMDLSYSMRDDLDNLKQLGSDIANSIAGITTNFRLGFGSFVDKPLAPFVDSTPARLNDPCNGGCEPTYSFKHIVSLSNDSVNFNARVQEQRISGNIDSPEGGFDGFLQSIVCQELIGWRENARRLLLYITDAGFHYAGDGKLAGVIMPHSGECLMGAQNGNQAVDYLDYDIYDFPSIGQIRENLREMDIIPMFAATSGASGFYTRLASELEGGIVGELASDSNNVVELIESSYQNVSQRVIIIPDTIQNIAVNVTPTECPSLDANGICEGLTFGKRADFNITVSLLQCLDDNSDQIVRVRVVGFGTFEIHVTPLCNCSCQSDERMPSDLCTNGNGTLECGVCDCNEGRFGDLCQCDATGQASGSSNMTCPLGPNGLTCSGRGQCVCGICQCQRFSDGREFFGKACECDNFQCDRDPLTGLLCGGEDRGVCKCNRQCECLTSPISGLQYTGSSCDCSPDNNTCIAATSDNVICSGNGECVCGECECINGYTGSFCEICTNISVCPVVSCNANQRCAECALNITIEGCEECKFEMVERDEEFDINGNAAVTCDFTDDDGCEYRYFVALDDSGNSEPVNVNNRRECPTRIAPWIIPVSIIGALLIIGIITLIIIKIILTLLDYIEVKKFMKEVDDPSFKKNENPLFQNPSKDYKNPVYGQ